LGEFHEPAGTASANLMVTGKGCGKKR
jgi:hypothetical protein